MFDKKNYYEILGVSPSESEKALKERFRKLMKLYHPDVNRCPDAAARYAEIMEAYRTLSDKSARTMYDLANNVAGGSSVSCGESPSVPSGGTAPREETLEARKERYERLLREKRARERMEKDDSFSPHAYLARGKVWLALLASSFTIAFLSVFLEKAASLSGGDTGVFAVAGAAFALTLMIWLVYLTFRLSAAYLGYRLPKAVFWIWGFSSACLYDAVLGRSYGAAGYGDSFFMRMKGVAFLPGLLIFFLIFSYAISFLETKSQIRQVQPQRTGRTRRRS
jgi:hypothetical protein